MMVTSQGSRHGSQQESARGETPARSASPARSQQASPGRSPHDRALWGAPPRFRSPVKSGSRSPIVASRSGSPQDRSLWGPSAHPDSPPKSGAGSPRGIRATQKLRSGSPQQDRPLWGSPARSGSPAKSGSGSPRPASPHYMQHIQSKATSTAPPPRFGPKSPPKSPRQRKPEVIKVVHLPQFVRFKSQALCRYLMVHPDKKGTPGKLLFCGKQDKTNPFYMFEVVHVPGMNQTCKIKSMATGKFWKRVPLNKVPECKSAIADGGFFSVILAKGDSEFDGDVFTYKKQNYEIGGLESKLISLWSQDDNKFVAPFCIIKDEKSGDLRYFLGCKPVEEKFNNTYYFHAVYHQHWHVTPDPVVSLGKYGFGF